MADWDDEDFDVDAGLAGDGPNNDKWEGEDEEEVKDNWEDEEDEKKLPATSESDGVKAFQVQKKKPLSERIQEKEEKKRKNALEKQKQNEEEEKELTPAEIQAEKARQQQIEEEADLILAKEMFGMSTTAGPSIDKMQPNNKEEFAEFAKLLKEKILQFEKSPHYCELLEDVFPGVSAGLDADVLKKLGSNLTAIGNEKSKSQKVKGKKKKKAALVGGGKSGRRDEFDDYGDEYDDFM